MVRAFFLDSDGVTYRGQFTTNFLFPAKVKYYDPAFTNGHGGLYVATSAGVNLCWCSQPAGQFGTFTAPSNNGGYFTSAGGLLVPSGQPWWDAGQLVADGDGWIRSYPWDLQALIGVGQNQYTAGVYVRQFGLSLP